MRHCESSDRSKRKVNEAEPTDEGAQKYTFFVFLLRLLLLLLLL